MGAGTPAPGAGADGLGVAGAAFVLETSTRAEGTDGDNAAQSLVYLQQHGTAYAVSGVCLVVAALGVIRAATAVPWRTSFLTAVGSVAGGLWVFVGALRISSPGPIDHIGGYDEDWGEAAYLVVQMAGNQGALLGGVALVEFWIVSGCLLAWRGARCHAGCASSAWWPCSTRRGARFPPRTRRLRGAVVRRHRLARARPASLVPRLGRLAPRDVTFARRGGAQSEVRLSLR